MNLVNNASYFNYSEIKMCRICESPNVDTLICFYSVETSHILNNLRQISDVKVRKNTIVVKL